MKLEYVFLLLFVLSGGFGLLHLKALDALRKSNREGLYDLVEDFELMQGEVCILTSSLNELTRSLGALKVSSDPLVLDESKHILDEIKKLQEQSAQKPLDTTPAILEELQALKDQFMQSYGQSEASKVDVILDFKKELQDFPALKMVHEIKAIHEVFKKDVIFFLSYIKGLDVLALQNTVESVDHKVDQLRTELSSHKIPMKFG